MSFLGYISDQVLNTIYVMTQFAITAILLLIFPIYKKKYLKHMAFGHVVCSVSVFFLAFQNKMPYQIGVLLGNILLVMGLFVIYESYAIMTEQKVNKWFFITVFCLFGVFQTIFVYVIPDTGVRVVGFTFTSILGMTIVLLYYLKQLIKRFDMLLMIIFVILVGQVVISVYRIHNAVYFEEIVTLFRNASVLKIFLLYSTFSSIVRTMCVLAYNTRDMIQSD